MKTIKTYTALCSALLFVFIHTSAQIAAVKFTVYAPEMNATDKGVFITGSFNYWHVGDTLYKMNKTGENIYSITLPVFDNKRYEYKYTLGNWDRAEVTLADSETHNRIFISADQKIITDTVVKWKKVQPKTNNVSPQLQQLNAKKDSLMKKMQPELDGLLVLLKKDITNYLQPEPSRRIQKKLHKQAISKVGHIHDEVSQLLWDVITSLSPEQKQYILDAINQPAAQKDFINVFGKAFAEAIDK